MKLREKGFASCTKVHKFETPFPWVLCRLLRALQALQKCFAAEEISREIRRCSDASTLPWYITWSVLNPPILSDVMYSHLLRDPTNIAKTCNPQRELQGTYKELATPNDPGAAMQNNNAQAKSTSLEMMASHICLTSVTWLLLGQLATWICN